MKMLDIVPFIIKSKNPENDAVIIIPKYASYTNYTYMNLNHLRTKYRVILIKNDEREFDRLAGMSVKELHLVDVSESDTLPTLMQTRLVWKDSSIHVHKFII